jgi:putative methyltransferase (TIGR04325 family)
MLAKIKQVIKLIIPPIFIEIIKYGKNRNTFEGIYQDFSNINNLTSYNNESSNNTTFIEIDAKLENHSKNVIVSDLRSQISNLLSLLIASLDKDKITVLDYGGGAGSTYVDCIDSVDMSKVDYYIYDLPETIEIGKKAFLKSKVSSTPLFINNHNKIDSLDIVYLGSVLQYIQDYKKLLLSLIRKSPAFFLITDNFMGTHSTYATVQVNMAGRKMAYWIFQLNEIKEIFSSNGYQLIYSSKNHQPYHNFDNFPEKYQVHDSCNLLFQKMNFV